MPPSLLKPAPTSRLPALLVALALCFGAPLAQADNLADIQKLIKNGQYPQALEKTDAYIAGKPKDAQGRFMKGLILTEMNRPADAIAVFTKLTEDYPELPEPYNNLAVLYAQQKQYDKARTALEMAIRTHPAYAIAYENLGDVYSKLASQAYDKALQLDSSNAAAQSKLSLIRDLISTGTRPGSKPVATVKPAEPVKVAVAEPAKPAATVTPVAPPVTQTKPLEKPVEKPVEPPKAVEKPAEKPASPAKPAPDTANADTEVIAAVHGWAAAWSKKDVKAYLAHYAPSFETPNGMSRKNWEAEREKRIDKPGKIDITIDEATVTFNGDKATVKFRQHYKSATFSSSASKVLVLVRSGNKWLIQQERVS